MSTKNKITVGGLLAVITLAVCLYFTTASASEQHAPVPKAKPVISILADAKAEFSQKEISIPTPSKKPAFTKPSFVQSILKTAEASQQVESHSNTEADQKILPKTMPANEKAFTDRQARLCREIFDLQDAGEMKQADKKISQLKSGLLLGHIYAERYLHPLHYKASYAELKNWMENYADHPQAERIYALAQKRRPLGAKDVLPVPFQQKSISGNLLAAGSMAKPYIGKIERNEFQSKRMEQLKKEIRAHIEQNEPTLAMNILSNDYAQQFMDTVELDRLKAQIAAGYLYAGKLDKAQELSKEIMTRSGEAVPMAGWIYGLTNWQKGRYKKSAEGFEMAATSPYASGWLVSAASYWVSRTHMKSGNTKKAKKWLTLASTYPRTFYGLIATRALGREAGFDWSVPDLTRTHMKFITSSEQGKRAAALISVNRRDLAEAELVKIPLGRSAENRQALVAFAHHYKLPALSMRLGNAFNNNKGGLYDAALYPMPDWQPTSGFRIQPALIHAIARQESRFEVGAKNPSGATGLMQLMPATANEIAGEKIYDKTHGQLALKKPEHNLELGQAYVERLLNLKVVGQDLMSLAVAYNAGPGNLARWKKERPEIKDPLMFIETIPFSETRAFVERVLSNYWIYSIRMGDETPSLDAVAEGKWALYHDGSFKTASAQ